MSEYTWGFGPGSPYYDEREDLKMETIVINTEENQKNWAVLAVQQSKTLEVNTQQDYDNAAELCKDIKDRVKQIIDYWKPLKDKAFAAHKDICSKEKQLLDPFTRAEADIKSKMVIWQKQKLEEERLLREEQERWKKEQAEKLLEKAAEAEQAGQTERSEYMLEMAEQAQNMTFEAPKQHKTSGTSAPRVWKARVINDTLVPVEFAGTLIRPVDTSTLDKLAKATKGAMKIPGVEFYEDVQIRIR